MGFYLPWLQFIAVAGPFRNITLEGTYKLKFQKGPAKGRVQQELNTAGSDVMVADDGL